MSASLADIAALLDTILPGDDRYPSASQAGLPARMVRGPDLIEAATVILSLAGPDFADRDEAAREAVLACIETDHAAPFQALLTAAYTIYYSSPATLSVIAATTSYRHPPQPGGYVLPDFDESVLATVRNNPVSWRCANSPET